MGRVLRLRALALDFGPVGSYPAFDGETRLSGHDAIADVATGRFRSLHPPCGTVVTVRLPFRHGGRAEHNVWLAGSHSRRTKAD